MGTRHRQAVISKRGSLKIQQYGQWDGYPSGQGIDILEYLRSADLTKYQKNLTKIKKGTKAQFALVETDPNWPENHLYVSRDCGAKIHKMIESGEVPFVLHTEEHECRGWCEGFYTIDFQKGVFISEFEDKMKTYRLDKLPTNKKYLLEMEPAEESDE